MNGGRNHPHGKLVSHILLVDMNDACFCPMNDGIDFSTHAS